MRITVEFLHQINACKPQVRLFKKTFPNGTNLTGRSFKKAIAAGLFVEQFALIALKPAALHRYKRFVFSRIEKYSRIRCAAWKKYDRRTQSEFVAWREYERTEKAIRKECDQEDDAMLLRLMMDEKNWKVLPAQKS